MANLPIFLLQTSIFCRCHTCLVLWVCVFVYAHLFTIPNLKRSLWFESVFQFSCCFTQFQISLPQHFSHGVAQVAESSSWMNLAEAECQAKGKLYLHPHMYPNQYGYRDHHMCISRTFLKVCLQKAQSSPFNSRQGRWECRERYLLSFYLINELDVILKEISL